MKARSMLVDVKVVMMMFVVVRNGCYSTPVEIPKHGYCLPGADVRVKVFGFFKHGR